jgi:hypothetical protein
MSLADYTETLVLFVNHLIAEIPPCPPPKKPSTTSA